MYDPPIDDHIGPPDALMLEEYPAIKEDMLAAAIEEALEELNRLRKQQAPHTAGDMMRARAEAFSSAADTACNQWNGLSRTSHWTAMLGDFQRIWRNLKDISNDYHKLAEKLDRTINNG